MVVVVLGPCTSHRDNHAEPQASQSTLYDSPLQTYIYPGRHHNYLPGQLR